MNPKTIYVVTKITNINGEMTVSTLGASYDKAQAEAFATKMEKIVTPSIDIIDIFEAEEIA